MGCIVERPFFFVQICRNSLIRIRDNYLEYDLVPLPGILDLGWIEKASKIMNDLVKDLIAKLDHRDTLFFEEISEMIYNGILPRRYRSHLDDVRKVYQQACLR